MGTGAIIGIVVGAIVILLILWYIGTRNSLVAAQTDVEEAFSGMDIYMKKRYDLIPNLVNTVKGYAAHESETLEKVIAARNSAYNANRGDKDSVAKAEGDLSGALTHLFAVAEQYPQLKADTQFLNLQKELQNIETDIAQSRKYYTGTVKKLNQKIRMFPSSIVASTMGIKPAPYFEVKNESERENVTVDFSK